MWIGLKSHGNKIVINDDIGTHTPTGTNSLIKFARDPRSYLSKFYSLLAPIMEKIRKFFMRFGRTERSGCLGPGDQVDVSVGGAAIVKCV